MNFLLLGGDGFIGKNIQDRLNELNINFISIDLNDIDLTTKKSISYIVDLVYKEKITDIINLASTVGIKMFNGNNAIDASLNNQDLLSNITKIIIRISKKIDRKINYTWFSTSEVYGSSAHGNKNFKVSTNAIRSAYSQIKILGETYTKELFRLGAIRNYHIIRPFNPSGKYQIKGVVADMFYSAIKNGFIEYKNDTIRMISDIKKFTTCIINDLMLDASTEKDYFDINGTVFLKTLAEVIKEYVEKNNLNSTIELIKLPPDKDIKYRCLSKKHLKSKKQIKSLIFNILNQL